MSKLQELFSESRLVTCLGSGGVGKTTVAAAIALVCGSRGKKTLCLTVDPSKRLARALGLEGSGADIHPVDPGPFADANWNLSAELFVKQVDTRAILDSLVERYAPSDAARGRILQSPLYRHVATYLAGMQEYMAMEALFDVMEQGNFDVVVLDTPPTSNAIDFLDAPERLRGILDSPATGWLVDTAKGTGKIFGRGAQVILQGFSRFTGGGFLEEISQFLLDMNVMFEGFSSRSARVAELLRAPDTLRLVVTRPTKAHLQEAGVLKSLLAERAMAAHGLVVNALPTSFEEAGNPSPQPKEWLSWANEQGIDADLESRIWKASEWHQDRVRRAYELLARVDPSFHAQTGNPEILPLAEISTSALDSGGGDETTKLVEVARSIESAL